MNTGAQVLPPGGNVGMFGDNSVALHWEEYSGRQHVASETMNMPQSFLFPGVSALENVPVFEMPAEIDMDARRFIFYAIREIMGRYWDSLVEFYQQLISNLWP